MRLVIGQYRVKLPSKAQTLHVTVSDGGFQYQVLQVPFGRINELRKKAKVRGVPAYFEQWMDANEIRLYPNADKAYHLEIQNLPAAEVW